MRPAGGCNRSTVAMGSSCPHLPRMTHAAAHHSVTTISRSKGHSSVAAAAYRCGGVLTDDRTGRGHDYTQRRDVEAVALVGWSGDPASLWNAAEAAEKRGNATVARESTLALPAEFTPEERLRVSRGYALWLRDRYGVAAMVAIHSPPEKGSERNHHAHILWTTRAVDESGAFGAKTRILDGYSGRPEIEAQRVEWAKRCNSLLAKKGAPLIDPRSHKRRAAEEGGPVLPSAPHFGKAATAAIRKRKAKTPPGQYRARLRVEMEADQVAAETTMLKAAWERRQKAERDLQAAEAAAATAPLDRSAAPASATVAPQAPTHDPEKRAERMREALAALRPTEAPQGHEWSDETPPDGKPIKRRQRVRGRGD